MSISKNRVYFKGLDGLRAIGAFSVFLSHIELSKKTAGISNIFDSPFYNTGGHLGVLLFFVLSGFLITYLLLIEKEKSGEIQIKNFYFRRVLRIWPIYYVMIFVLFVIAPLVIKMDYYAKPDWDVHGVSTFTLMIYLLMAPNFVSFGISGLGGGFQLGSIGTEEQFYVIWPWILTLFKNLFIPILTLIALIPLAPHLFDYVAVHFFPHDSNKFTFLKQLGSFFTYFKINSMATGALMAVLYFRNFTLILKFLQLKSIQLTVLLLAFGGWLIGFELPYFSDEYYSFLFAVLILNTATHNKPMLSFNFEPLNYLGKISYGIYMYLWIIIYFFMDIFSFWEANSLKYNIALYSCSIFAAIFISHFSFFYFETYFLKWKQSFAIIKSNKT